MSVPEESVELQARPMRVPPTLTSFVLSLVVMLMTCGVAWYLHGEARKALIDEIQGSLARLARLTSARIDGDVHDRLRQGVRKDSAEYFAQNRFMLQLPAIDPEIAYAYTAIEQDAKVWLILDTEPPDGADDMDVMQPYDDAPEALRTALRERKALVSAPYTDQWGTFITAYAPFHNRAGQFAGVVGVDLGLAQYEARLLPMQRATWAIYGAGTVLSILIGLALYWSYKRGGAVEQLGRQLNNVNALLQVSKVLGSNVGLDNLLPQIVSSATSVMRAERSSLFLYDKGKRQLIGRVTEGAGAGQEFVIPDTRGVAGRVVRTGQLANVSDPRNDPDFDDAYDRQSGFRTRAILAVPILDAKKNVLGVLQALNPRDNQPFDHNDELMLTALAAQVQVALERERLNQTASESRKVDDALRFAQSIQLGMLPQRFPDPAVSGVELHAALLPAKVVGGDFYDFIWIDFNLLGLVIADVSGKGIPAALLMAKAMTLIRAHLDALQNPAEALRKANEELAKDNDQAMFVTAFVAMYDVHTGELTYSNAGHNNPLLLRAGQAQDIGGGMSVPLGADEGAEFGNLQEQLQPADVLFLFTDGVSEAMDPDNQEYGDQRMRDCLLANAALPMAGLLGACVDDVRSFARGAAQSDDITVMAMRVPAE